MNVLNGTRAGHVSDHEFHVKPISTEQGDLKVVGTDSVYFGGDMAKSSVYLEAYDNPSGWKNVSITAKSSDSLFILHRILMLVSSSPDQTSLSCIALCFSALRRYL